MMNKKFHFLYFLIIGIMGVLFLLWITPLGPGMQPDSIVYIGLAKGILSGKGYSLSGVPYAHFPPLYPFFLAIIGLVEKDLVQAARFLNAALFGLNISLFALSIYISTGRKFLTANLAILFLLSSYSFIEKQAWVLSESLFFSFFLTSFILLSMHIHYRKNLTLLILSALSLGLAILTRYVGIAFLPAAVGILLIWSKGQQIRRTFRDVAVYLGLACAPIAIFLVRNLLILGKTTDRNFAYHPLPVLDYIKEIWANVLVSITAIKLPNHVGPAILGLITLFIFAQLIILVKRDFKDIDWRSTEIIMAAVCILFSIAYLLFLWISISFVDASTPVDARILMPMLIMMITGIFSILWFITQELKKPTEWLSFLFLVSIFIGTNIPGTITSVKNLQNNGLGFNSLQWQDSESIAFIKSFPENARIFSNGADILGFLTGRDYLSIPKKLSPLTMGTNLNYNAEISAMCKDVIDEHAYLLFLDQLNYRKYLPSQADIELKCELPILKSLADGTVYGVER